MFKSVCAVSVLHLVFVGLLQLEFVDEVVRTASECMRFDGEMKQIALLWLTSLVFLVSVA